MKQIPLLQGKALLIELPEGTAMECVLHNKNGQSYLAYFENLVHRSVKLPTGNWRIIGMLSEVMEEQAAGLVEYTGLGNGVDRWLNYVNNGDKFTALESLDSAIMAEGYLLETPPAPECGCHGPSDLGACDGCDEWVESQSRVLDRSRCLLLGREGDG